MCIKDSKHKRQTPILPSSLDAVDMNTDLDICDAVDMNTDLDICAVADSTFLSPDEGKQLSAMLSTLEQSMATVHWLRQLQTRNNE